MKKADWSLETLNDRFKVYQGRKGYRFNLDSLLLAGYPRLRPGLKVLDIGTGMGIIPILFNAKQEELVITAVEIQPEMVRLARANMDMNGLKQVTILHEDVRDLDVMHHNHYDLVVCNPPYYRGGSGDTSPNPQRCAARHEGPLCLRELVHKAWKMVAPRGKFICIYPASRLGEVLDEITAAGFFPLRIRFVYPKADRPARVFLVEAGKDAGKQMQVEKPLVMHEADERYTPEMERIMGGGRLD